MKTKIVSYLLHVIAMIYAVLFVIDLWHMSSNIFEVDGQKRSTYLNFETVLFPFATWFLATRLKKGDEYARLITIWGLVAAFVTGVLFSWNTFEPFFREQQAPISILIIIMASWFVLPIVCIWLLRKDKVAKKPSEAIRSSHSADTPLASS